MPVDRAKIARIQLEADVLRALHHATGWLTTDQVARATRRPDDVTRVALARLNSQGAVSCRQAERGGPFHWRLAR
jgi:hypothetical protein